LQQTSGQGTSLFFLTWPHWLNLSCPSLLPGANPIYWDSLSRGICFKTPVQGQKERRH
jgi:hypothetical protein